MRKSKIVEIATILELRNQQAVTDSSHNEMDLVRWGGCMWRHASVHTGQMGCRTGEGCASA